MSESYIRVGTVYYKIVLYPRPCGELDEIFLIWNASTIIADHGKAFLSTIPRYDGFCLKPDHINYCKQIGTFYNSYHSLSYQPKEGSWYITKLFLEHIFQEQFDIAMDYFKVLYERPTQILPILCLVSRERGTGKTTFLNWVKQIFGKNATMSSNADFRSRFNSHWVNKLVVCIDEASLTRQDDFDLIKTLSTARVFQQESKGVNRQEVDFYGKFILCSNNTTSFVYIDQQESRFWVREVPSFSGELLKNIKELREGLVNEIPAFLNAILCREFYTKSQSRMWFTSSQIETPALRRLKASAKSKLQCEMEDILLVIFEETRGDEVKYTVNDIVQLLKLNGVTSTHSEIKHILTKCWSLRPSTNSNSYTLYSLTTKGEIKSSSSKGRYYNIKLSDVKNDEFDDY